MSQTCCLYLNSINTILSTVHSTKSVFQIEQKGALPHSPSLKRLNILIILHRVSLKLNIQKNVYKEKIMQLLKHYWESSGENNAKPLPEKAIFFRPNYMPLHSV